MRMSCRRDIWMRGSAISATALVVFALGASSALARDISQSGEQKNMRRVGHSDLQGRAAYHPDFIRYPDGRVIAFVGTHSNTTDNGPRPNPLQPGSPVEPNGTMIVDITNPSKAVDKFHIPGPIPTGAAQTQSNRICLGSDLPGGTPGQVYMMRNVQVGNLAVSGYEVWNVTDVTNPTLGGSVAQPSQHAQALVGVQDRYRLPAGQPRRAGAAMAPGAVDDDRRLEESC